ncbi:Gustatory receptor 8, partial [Frankliniella occidentalis]
TFYFRWLSLPIALTVPSWLGLCWLASVEIGNRLSLVSGVGKHYHLWDLVPEYCTAVCLSYIYFIPVACWASSRHAVALIKFWHILETQIADLYEPIPRSGLRCRAWVFCALCILPPFAISLLSLRTSQLVEKDMWTLIINVHSFFFPCVGVGFWFFCCYGLRAVALNQAGNLLGDFQRLGVAGLRAHRRVWQRLARVLHLLCVTLGRMQIVLFTILFTCYVSISFLFTHFAIDRVWDRRSTICAVLYAVMIVGVVTTCVAAEFVSQALRRPATHQLFHLASSTKSDYILSEIQLFLADIEHLSPKATVLGFGSLGRSSIISFLSLATTYTIVLSQLTVSSETTVKKFEEVDFYDEF